MNINIFYKIFYEERFPSIPPAELICNFLGTKVVVLLTKHDKMKAPSMTPSKYTSDYFDGLNIPCIVKSDKLRRKHSELKPFHGQRFFVMDEPAEDENKKVNMITVFESI